MLICVVKYVRDVRSINFLTYVTSYSSTFWNNSWHENHIRRQKEFSFAHCNVIIYFTLCVACEVLFSRVTFTKWRNLSRKKEKKFRECKRWIFYPGCQREFFLCANCDRNPGAATANHNEASGKKTPPSLVFVASALLAKKPLWRPGC